MKKKFGGCGGADSPLSFIKKKKVMGFFLRLGSSYPVNMRMLDIFFIFVFSSKPFEWKPRL